MDPRPPHGVFDLAPSATLGLTRGLVIVALVVFALLALLLVYLKWRQKKAPKAASAPRLSPWEELAQKLAQAEAQGADAQGIEILNHSLRRGLELRHPAPFTALTSAEILAYLKQHEPFSSDFQAQCAEFLKLADRVLFAARPCDPNEFEHWRFKVKEWIEALQSERAL